MHPNSRSNIINTNKIYTDLSYINNQSEGMIPKKEGDLLEMTKYKFPSLRLSSDSVVSSETMRRSSSGVEGKSQTAFSTMKSVEFAIVMFRSNDDQDPTKLLKTKMLDFERDPMKQRGKNKTNNDFFLFFFLTTKGIVNQKKEERTTFVGFHDTRFYLFIYLFNNLLFF